MSTTSSKFSIENFEPTPDDELICSICRCIFDEPMECPCRHIFCRSCISNWLELKRSCPICRKYVSSFDLKSVAPLIKNMISKLTMICPNRNNGCRSKITLDSYNGHVSRCLYEIISCKNSSCSGMYLRKDIEQHEKVDCEFRLIMCESDCNLMLPLSKVKKHNCIRELKQRLEEFTKREETLNKHIEELTNELNTLKKKNTTEENRENRRFYPYFSFISSDDGSNSYADSLSTETNEYLSDSRQSLFQNLRSRLSSLTMSLTDLEDSLVSSNNRSRSNSNTVEERRPSDMSLEIISDIDNNNSTLSTVGSLGSTSEQSSSNYTISSYDSDSNDVSTASQSVLEIAASDDDEFPTVAQRRILKRKHSSVVSISSESDEGSVEIRTRRRRSTEQRNHPRPSGDARTSSKSSNTASGSKTKLKKNSSQPASSPRSLVPVEVPSSVGTRSSFPAVNNTRSSGLEKTRELLEMFSVETDPDWEPSEGLSSDDELPAVRSVPAADILDHILDDSDIVGLSPAGNNANGSNEESDDDNYEVLVPERTYDLLVRYSQEDSGDDSEWLPPHLRLDTSEESDGEFRPR